MYTFKDWGRRNKVVCACWDPERGGRVEGGSNGQGLSIPEVVRSPRTEMDMNANCEQLIMQGLQNPV